MSYGMDNVYSDDQREQNYRCPFDDGIVRDTFLYRDDPYPLKQNDHLFYASKIQCVDAEYEQPSFHDAISLLTKLILWPFSDAFYLHEQFPVPVQNLSKIINVCFWGKSVRAL
jgi:hypothetical protein